MESTVRLRIRRLLLSVLGGDTARHLESPPSAPAVEGGPMVVAEDRAMQEPHRMKNRARHGQAAVFAWAGDAAHDMALERSGWPTIQR